MFNTQIGNNMKHAEQVRNRIETKGIRAEDIKHSDRLTDAQIASISVESAYMWVRSGEWKIRDFKTWLASQVDMQKQD